MSTGIIWPLDSATFSTQEQVEIATRIAEFVAAGMDACDEAAAQAAEADAKAMRRTLDTHPYSRQEQVCVLNYAETAEDYALQWRAKAGKESARIESAREHDMRVYLDALDKLADAMDVLEHASQPDLPASMLRSRPMPELEPMGDVALGRERDRARRDADALRDRLAECERYSAAVASVKGRAAKVATTTLDAIITEYRARLDAATGELAAIDAELASRAERAERDRIAAAIADDPAAAILALRQRLDGMDDTDAALQEQLDLLRGSVGIGAE